MFKTTAEKSPRGNYDVAATCRNGHTGYKKRGDNNTYTCPYCGHDMS